MSTHINRFPVLAALVIASVVSFSAWSQEADAHFFVLKANSDGEFHVERIPIQPENTLVFPAGVGEGIIDVIMPVGHGGSAGLTRLKEVQFFIVRYTDGELSQQVRKHDGSKTDYPARTLSDLAADDIRLSVTAHDGSKSSFRIEGYETVSDDSTGPAVNPFAGRLPFELVKGDFIIYTDTYSSETGSMVYGEATLEYNKYFFVEATLPDGSTGLFILDIGASGSVIRQKALPKGTEIVEVSTVEYSSQGKRFLKYAPGGATGPTTNVLGVSTLESFTFGNLTFDDVSVSVMEDMMSLAGREIDGIIGMNLLRRAEHLIFEFKDDNTIRMSMQSEQQKETQREILEVPYSYLRSRLVVPLLCNNTEVFCILDTGCPAALLLDESAADVVTVQWADADPRLGGGIDGGKVPIRKGSIETLQIARHDYSDLHCEVAHLAAFDSLRTPDQHAALLGNEFFSLFTRMEIDFANHVVRFVE